MTREKAIDLVKVDLKECEPNVLENISEFEAVPINNTDWDVVCKFKTPVQSLIGQSLDSVTYMVRDDGTVLVYPE